MTFASRIKWACGLSLAAIVALPMASSRAAGPSGNADEVIPPADAAAPDAAASGKTPLDLFDAMKSGDIEVKFIAKNSRDGQLLVKNKTDQPLTVKLPEAFAAVPVLAQAAAGGGVGGNNKSYNKSSSNNQNQGLGGGGGGFGGGGIGGGIGGGGGAFDVAPEKVAKIKLETVCLEHGKKEPTAIVPYEIRPIETFTSDPKVQELCKLLGTGQLNQRAAQAAAWHLANHMTWEQLIDKKIHHLLGGDEIYFTADDIRAAMQISDRAIKLADARESGSSSSASQDTASSNSSAASSGK
jgi:hypothetical protein